MLSTPIELNRFEERKRWSCAIAKRFDFPEKNAFEGYSAEFDPLSRLEIAAKLKKIRSCGNLLELRAAPGGEFCVHNFQKCGQVAVCPICAARAQAMRKKRFEGPIEGLAALCGAGAGSMPRKTKWPVAAFESFSGLSVYMVTATVRPREKLRDALNDVTIGWRRLRRMGQVRGPGRSKGEFGKVVAGIAKVEIKRGKDSGLWHPHIHALLFTRERLDYRTFDGPRLYLSDPLAVNKETGEVPEILLSKISLEWLKATKGRSYNIRVDNLRTYWKNNHKVRGISFEKSVNMQAKEVLKYATKWNADPVSGSMEFIAADYVEVIGTTYCRRLFATYGYFRRIPGDDFVGNENGENLNWNIPGKQNPEIYAARWNYKGYSDLEKKAYPLFDDSDSSAPLIPWEVMDGGGIRVRENPRAAYLRAVASVNGEWRRRRSLVLKMRERARLYKPARAVERLFNIIRHKASEKLSNLRVILKPWYQDTGPPPAVAAALFEKYLASKAYHEKIIAAFLEVLQAPGAALPAI